MSTAVNVLHPAGFIETGSCSGPRLLRIQPSRESEGVLLNDVTEKYVSEFTVPFRNSVRTLKTLKMNWDKVSDEDKIKIMSMIGPFYKDQQKPKQQNMMQRSFAVPADINTNNNLSSYLDSIMSPTEDIKKIYTEQDISNMKTELDQWILKKTWYMILIIVFLLCIVMFLSTKYSSLLKKQ